MPNPDPNLKGELLDLLLSIEQERKNHTARMLGFEKQIRALLGGPNVGTRKKSCVVEMSNGRKRTATFVGLE
jgi:hypothetical protein